MAQSGTATFLFSELIDSTQHLQTVGDEMGERSFRAHHKMITEAITGNGGQELQWLGDGALAVFSSAADAVRCAIAMQRTARRPVAGTRFELRIGIHTGEALRREGGYFGTPVVIARRLCDRSSSGQILCSALIAELLAARQGFSFHKLGKFDLKGIAAPLETCEVVYQRNDPAALLSRTPFVGRAAHLSRLAAKLEEASNGRGGVAMLVGEAGIGKTRIIEEFADHAQQRAVIVLRGACYEGEWQPPYGPFAEAISEYARQADPTVLASVLSANSSTLLKVAPALREWVTTSTEAPAMDKEEERFRVLDSIAQFFIAVARRTPLVLVLDDLHWAERGTVSVLAHVAHFVSSNRILLIGAYRDAEINRTHPLAAALAEMRRRAGFDSFALKGLGGDELAALLGMIGDSDAPHELVEAIGSETGGNPLFIREMLLHLVEEGELFEEGRWTSHFTVGELAITEGVREVIGRRMLRLSDPARELLSVGAAFNGAFPFDIATRVAGLEEEEGLSAVDEAIEAKLLRPATQPDRFEFTHALIRNTLYSEISPARRARVHRKIAEAMELAWGERAAEHAAEVAYQFSRASTLHGSERGADYALAAADYAEAAYAHDEVAAFLRIALDLLPKNSERRPRLLARLSLALPWGHNHEGTLEVPREASELIAASEGASAAADFVARAATAMHSAGLVRAAWDLSRDGLRFAAGRRDIAWAKLAELELAREDAEDPANPGVLTDCPKRRELRAILKGLAADQLKAYGIDPPFESRQEIVNDPQASPVALVLMAGEFRRGLALWQNAAVDTERQGRIALATTAWAFVAGCHVALGDFFSAKVALDRTTSLYARSTGAAFRIPSIYLSGVRYQLLIATDDGWERFFNEDDIRRLFKEPAPENKWSFALTIAVSAYVLARLGRVERSLERLSMLPRAFQVGAFWEMSYGPMVCDAVSALWLLNRPDNSQSFEQTLREKVLAPDFRFPMRDSRLSLARLCALEGRYDEAADWFEKARIVLDEQGARPLHAITDFDQGLMYLRRGLPGDARTAQTFLDAARRQFGELGMTGWSRRVETEPALLESRSR